MLQIDFSEKIAAVTGGASGIGAATARLLAECGAKVVVLDRSVEGAGAQGGPNAKMYELDVTRADDVEAAIDSIEREVGSIDVLVNAAGVLQRVLAPDLLPEKEWDRTITTNLKGTYLCCVATGKRMVRRGRGSIVNVASVVGLCSGPLHAYGPAKAGVINLTQGLAAEWGGRGVRVNAVAPGFTRTPALKLALAAGYLDEATLKRAAVMDRLLAPEEVAAAIAFLACDLAGGITGVTLPVDAGYLITGSWAAYAPRTPIAQA